MKTTSLQQTISAEHKTSGLVPPFGRDELHQAVFETYLILVRAVSFMVGNDAAWSMLGKTSLSDQAPCLLDPELPVSWLEVGHTEIAETPFAKKMEAMYDYAYFGEIDLSEESMEYEGIYMWISDFLSDMSTSNFASELDEFGETNAINSAQRCFRVAETANARRVLEGHEAFAPNLRNGKDEDISGFDALTVRQMAHLANMEEMSIRAAANPKRANPLITFSEAGRTLISPSVAKEWLKSKGRYVQIIPRWSAGSIDLARTQFSTPSELLGALDARRRLLGGTRHEPEQEPSDLDKRLSNIGIEYFWSLEHAKLDDAEFVRQVAEVMDLPSELLVLRAQESLLRNKLAHTEYLIRESKNPPQNTEASTNG